MAEEEYPSPAEQAAFSATRDLLVRLVEDGLPAEDVGKGALTAAISTLRKGMDDKRLAMTLYEAADDFGTRTPG